jgi:glucose/arabinose dehydrogenase
MLAVNGADVDVTRREQGDVLLLRDVNNDGRADQHTPVARRPMMHGIAIHDGKMYLATIHEVYVADIKPDGDARRAAADLAGCAVMADGSVLVSDDRKSVAAFTPNRRGAVGR